MRLRSCNCSCFGDVVEFFTEALSFFLGLGFGVLTVIRKTYTHSSVSAKSGNTKM